MTRIQNYFNGVADKIAGASLIASTAQHRPDIGSNREDIVRDFLLRHLPRRLFASIGGQVISHDGRESGQIDVIVSNDLGVRFDENEKTFVTAESVAGAITVKSSLKQATLNDALVNLASIPEPSQAAKRVASKFSGPAQSKHFLNVILRSMYSLTRASVAKRALRM